MRVNIQWKARDLPLEPIGVFVPQSQMSILANRLLLVPEEHYQFLEGLRTRKGIVILGQDDYLPWVDGCIYLGRGECAPHVITSVHHQPSIPIGLLDKAICKKFAQTVVLIPGCDFAIPVQSARRLSREKFEVIS